MNDLFCLFVIYPKDENEIETSLQSQSLRDSQTELSQIKYQELILGNQNGEAKFENMFME